MLDKLLDIFLAACVGSLGVFAAFIVLAGLYAILMVFIDRF